MESESRSSAEVARFAELLAPLGAALDDKVQNPPSDPMNRYSQWECLISEPLPKTGVGVDAVLDELLTVLVPNGGRVSDPGFWPFITSAPTTAPFLAATAAAIAAPVRLGIQAFNAVEERSLEWLVELFGLDRQMRGLYSSGGSSANLVALGAARQSAFEARGLNPAADGINGVPCALYASTETHHTVQRAAAVLGIGRNQVRVLPTAADLRLQPDVLAAAIDADLAAGILPIAAVANAGSTNTGTIDLLRALGRAIAECGFTSTARTACRATSTNVCDTTTTESTSLTRSSLTRISGWVQPSERPSPSCATEPYCSERLPRARPTTSRAPTRPTGESNRRSTTLAFRTATSEWNSPPLPAEFKCGPSCASKESMASAPASGATTISPPTSRTKRPATPDLNPSRLRCCRLPACDTWATAHTRRPHSTQLMPESTDD